MKKECVNCGGELTGGQSRFCSARCSSRFSSKKEYNKKRRRAYEKELRQTAKDIGNCINCFKEKESEKYTLCYKCREYKSKYDQRPEVKSKRKKYNQRPEVKTKQKACAKRYNKKPEVKIKKKEYSKEYHQRPEVKERLREYYNNRLLNDINFKIKTNLRRRLRKAMELYTKEGRITSSKYMGIDWKKVVEQLAKNLPKDYYEREYHIDHIKPLCSFDLEDSEQVKVAFAPDNHQWLLAEENLSKGGKYDFLS